jgi:hypothetical protein
VKVLIAICQSRARTRQSCEYAEQKELSVETHSGNPFGDVATGFYRSQAMVMAGVGGIFVNLQTTLLLTL